MNDYFRQFMHTSFLLAGSALLPAASLRMPLHLALPLSPASGPALFAIPFCAAGAASEPGYLAQVALAIANSDSPLLAETPAPRPRDQPPGSSGATAYVSCPSTCTSEGCSARP